MFIATSKQSRKAHLGILLLVCVIAVALFVAQPQSAHAKEYSMPAVDIQATVGSDGSIHVVEERTFSFSGSFSCVWWEFDAFEREMNLLINGVSIAFPESSIPEFERLNSVPFEKSWRSAGGPGVTSYSVDEALNGVYVFFSASNTDMVVRLDYTVEHAAHLYDDVGELYWQFVGPGWAESSKNVSCTIDLPANGQTATPGDTVRAWGHGSLDGTVHFNDEGTQVSLEIPRVSSGEFAETRITFPREWLGDVDASYARSGSILPEILEEEQREADAANRHRMIQAAGSGAFGLLGLGGIIWSAIMFLRHGREHKPTFIDKYWRDVPNKTVHPVVIGRLMRWNRESSDDVVTTIMHLANLGVVSIGKGNYDQPSFMGVRQVEDYFITLNESVANNLVNPIDKKLVQFLFGDIAHGRPSMWLSEIAAWGKDHPHSFTDKMKSWQGVVTGQVDAQEYFELQGATAKTSVIAMAVVLFVLGFVATALLENLLPVGFALLAAVVMVVFGLFMPRRSQKGADDFARAKALRNWLTDFTLLNERVPTDVKVWGHFMVYAQLFGIAKKVANDLRGVVPEMFVADDTMATGNGTFVTWYSWYGDGRIGAAAGQSFASAFDRTITNTFSTARAALAAEGISDTISSGVGGGGGFSGGGGGGFGGGGGGAR